MMGFTLEDMTLSLTYLIHPYQIKAGDAVNRTLGQSLQQVHGTYVFGRLYIAIIAMNNLSSWQSISKECLVAMILRWDRLYVMFRQMNRASAAASRASIPRSPCQVSLLGRDRVILKEWRRELSSHVRRKVGHGIPGEPSPERPVYAYRRLILKKMCPKKIDLQRWKWNAIMRSERMIIP